jgi:hypothetical protein
MTVVVVVRPAAVNAARAADENTVIRCAARRSI